MNAELIHKFQGRKVMWVEDDQFLGSMIEKKFGAAGCQLAHLKDGESALAAINAGDKPDIAIIDLVLPGVDGFAVIKALRANANTADIPTAVLSNLSDEKDVAKAKELGVNLYLVKASLTLDEILEKIAAIIR